MAGFLDNVCTDIIHYEDKKLVHYPGNLSEFVKACRLFRHCVTVTEKLVHYFGNLSEFVKACRLFRYYVVPQ